MEQKDENIEQDDVELYDADVGLYLELDEIENTPKETNQDIDEIALEPMEKPILFEWVEALIVAVFTVIFVFIFIARPVGVDGESMLPTLNHGDNLIISNLFYEPSYGDIVVLTADNYYNGEKALVKRIIATEGQEIDIDFNTGEVSIDGVVIDEPYIYETTHLYEGTDFPQVVPENCVFVMGDNRNNSTDSRTKDIGMVPIDCILGRVIFRILPINDIGIVE
ncbi:MAG: signal peptidase I [Clostridia bacterium]